MNFGVVYFCGCVAKFSLMSEQIWVRVATWTRCTGISYCSLTVILDLFVSICSWCSPKYKTYAYVALARVKASPYKDRLHTPFLRARFVYGQGATQTVITGQLLRDSEGRRAAASLEIRSQCPMYYYVLSTTGLSRLYPVQLISPWPSLREAGIYCQLAVTQCTSTPRPVGDTQVPWHTCTYICAHKTYLEISNLNPFHPYLFSSQLEIENKFCFNGLPGQCGSMLPRAVLLRL